MMYKVLHSVGAKLLDIFFPKKCVICGEYGDIFCFSCLEKLEKSKTDVCPECGKITKNSRYCPGCKGKFKSFLNAVFITCSYHQEGTKALISNFKYVGLTALSEIIGELMYQRIANKIENSENTVIIPVPLHIRRLRYRGFNQSELLARYISKRLHIAGGDALLRAKNTKNQVGLRRQQRLSNISSAFRCQDKEFVRDKNIILIDDVVTTGATLNECAKVLKAAGAKRVIGLVFARNK